MATKQQELRERTKQFALRVVKLFHALPARTAAGVLGKQLLRSGTSVAANYRAAARSRSRAEFAARIGIVVEEADESLF
jgi:four helix bundle protein